MLNVIFFFAGESPVRRFAAVWIYSLISGLVVYNGFWSIFRRGAALNRREMKALEHDRQASTERAGAKAPKSPAAREGSPRFAFVPQQTIRAVLTNNFKSLYNDYLGDAVGEERDNII